MQTILILHGWKSSKEKWQKVKESLEIEGFEVIVPDLPGFKKETELKKSWKLDDYVSWVKELVDAQHVESFFLLGHSFGGRIAIKLASQGFKELKGLILVSAAGIQEKKFCFGKVAKALRIYKCPCWPFFRKCFYKFVLRKTDYLNVSGALKETMKNVLKEDLTDLLEKIKVPTYIIWGKKDKYTPLRHGLLMKEKIKNSKMDILKGIGHAPYLENPKLVSDKIRDYVSKF